MSVPRYLWRTLTPEQRNDLLAWRQEQKRPWHSPQHRPNFGHARFHVTAACFEHKDIIGFSPERMDSFSSELLDLVAQKTEKLFAWCVLPNHYHTLVATPDILGLIQELGKFHGRTAFYWNGADEQRGRKVFFRAVERAMRSDRHFKATLNYVHHNPVHHGYVDKWTDWRWSSATQYLAQIGGSEAKQIWRDYPIDDYGHGWDDPDM
jgi:putative transposase